ncbi:MAG: molybdopterin-binding protein [Pseudomonadota bacterium]
MPQPTAAIVAIGDELLSGRTKDINIGFLADWLTARNVALREARIVADDIGAIAEAVNAMRASHDYVFTSGGIGPTHDDITVEGVAAAFEVDVIEHPDAIALLERWYASRNEEVTPARRRMARTPAGAVLIQNRETGAPGVRVDNVFVLAGVPSIFRAMLSAIEPEIEGGAKVFARAVTAPGLPESRLASGLAAMQEKAPAVTIGSYPIDDDERGVTIVARSEDASAVDRVIEEVSTLMRSFDVEPVPGDRK